MAVSGAAVMPQSFGAAKSMGDFNRRYHMLPLIRVRTKESVSTPHHALLDPAETAQLAFERRAHVVGQIPPAYCETLPRSAERSADPRMPGSLPR